MGGSCGLTQKTQRLVTQSCFLMKLSGVSQGSGFTSKKSPPVLPPPVPLISHPSLGTKTTAETAELPEAE